MVSEQLNLILSNNWLQYKLKIDETASKVQFADSLCACKSCNHVIALDCINTNCPCCKETDHSMVLDGKEGFSSQ
jgi:Zn finger protein HypA/HybF involved in hydrogenase expression